MTDTDLFSVETGSPVRVGPELARGGEGSVHVLPDRPDRLLKLYLAPPGPEKIEKLTVMVQGASAALTKVAAWPVELVADSRQRTRGFIMPRIASSEQAHELYTPRSRAKAFPQADFRFVLHVAANVVRAFGVVHAAGYVIGDVNHGQVLVCPDGTVALVDCDSIQVQSGGRLYTCDYGTPLFTPPELQGRPFRGLPRTADHDRFGLAVLLFQLLFMGRHPYAGTPLDPRQSTEIETAIKAGRFAYGADRKDRGIDQPPGSLPLSTYGPGVSALFEGAFARSQIEPRPDETAWLGALRALQGALKACSANTAHHYPGHLAACPWCAIEGRTGAGLFGQRLDAAAGNPAIDLAALWRAVAAIPPPPQPPAPVFASISLPAREPAERARLRLRNARRIMALVLAPFLFGVADVIPWPRFAALAVPLALVWWIWPRVRRDKRQAAHRALDKASTAFEEVQRRWEAAADGEEFQAIRQACELAKAEMERLPSERVRRLAMLMSPDEQCRRFLDGFRIAHEKIPGIGPGRSATLASFGIETAGDVTTAAVTAVPGFGPAMAAKLVAWRASKEARFAFDPDRPVPMAEIKAVEAEIEAARRQHATTLMTGPGLLRQASRKAEATLAQTGPLLEKRWIDWQLAKRRVQDL